MAVRKTITAETLRALHTSFSSIFNNQFTAAAPVWSQIAERVNSTTKIETYTWLAQIPGMREWIDERFIKRLEQEAYTLVNRKFEDTIAVARDDIEDDQIGTYSMLVRGLASAAAEHPDELVFKALLGGFDNPCYDGQNFFDTDHPVRVDGRDTSVSNMQAGAGQPWFLLATNRPVKPLIYQDRIAAELTSHTDPGKSDHVFMQDEFLWGTRSRGAAGYAYWQTAFASKAELNAENFQAARQAMSELKGDEGRPLNVVPNLLVIPPSLETEAEEILVVDRLASGATNPNKGKAKILMTPWAIAA